MLEAVKQHIAGEPTAILRPAVVAALGEDNLILVRMETGQGQRQGWAMPMADSSFTARVGDTVLVAGEDIEACYVLGLLKRRNAAPEEAMAISTRSGAAARIVEHDGEEVMQVKDPENRVLFSYQPKTGKCVLSAAIGDLVLDAPQGNIDLVSGKNIRFQGSETITMLGGQEVTIGTRTAPDRQPTAIRLGPENLDLGSRNFGLAASRADLRVGRGRYQGRALSATVKSVRVVADRLETMAGSLVQRARNLFGFVENLRQIRAGRSRTLVDDAYHLKARRTYLKARQEVKIDGRKIDLG